MSTEPLPQGAAAEILCPDHHEPARWQCGVCGKPVCSACKPMGLNYQVFHRACLAQAHQKIDQHENARRDVDAPSPGLKFIAWAFMIFGIVAFGVALLTIGFSLFSTTIPIRALISGTIPASLDSIAGGRTFLNWVIVLSLVSSVVIAFLGAGLLNCIASARYAVLLLAWLEIIVAVFAWLVILVMREGFWDIPVTGIVLVAYFLRKDVRRQFEKVL